MYVQVAADLFYCKQLPDVVLVGFYPKTLDEVNAANLAENLLDVAQGSDARKLYLNFNNVRNVSRDVWHELIDLNQFLQESGWRICLLHLTSALSHQLRTEEASVLAATGEGLFV